MGTYVHNEYSEHLEPRIRHGLLTDHQVLMQTDVSYE